MKQILLLILLLLTQPATADNRIASLNLCLDQILLNWLPPQKIASVTWLSADDHYRKAPLPPHVYLNRGRAEELLRLDPDLILVGQFGAQRAAARLRDLGFNVVAIPDAYSLEQLGRVSLEEVVAAQPDLLVLYGGEKDFAIAHLAARHPVLKTYLDSGRVYTLPAELGFCPALVAADVLQQLTEKRKSLVEQR